MGLYNNPNVLHTPNVDELRELLLWHKIVKAEIRDETPEDGMPPVGYLTLDNGTRLKVWGNDGGCACSNGCYSLTELNTVDNAITAVEVLEDPATYNEGAGIYAVFVLAEDRRIKVAEFSGDDGNGYYGTGWWLEVETDNGNGES